MASIQQYYAHGKLLLAGEYFILDGAKGLAIPTQQGQSMEVKIDSNVKRILTWKSLDSKGVEWLSVDFNLEDISLSNYSDLKFATKLQSILVQAQKQCKLTLSDLGAIQIKTQLEFPRDWGLGSSSTLIYMIAQWLEIDAYQLLKNSIGGSGYDVACADAQGPITYQLFDYGSAKNGVDLEWPFKEQLYFIHLGKKQDSGEGIQHYRSRSIASSTIDEVSTLTDAMVKVTELESFDRLIEKHENLVSKELGLKRAKELYFEDYWGAIKSLGAWGGDFVIATSNRPWEETALYFEQKGFPTVLGYDEMILD